MSRVQPDRDFAVWLRFREIRTVTARLPMLRRTPSGLLLVSDMADCVMPDSSAGAVGIRARAAFFVVGTLLRAAGAE